MAPTQNRPKIQRLIPTQSGLSISITLLEQAIFVNSSLASPSVLRGCVELIVAKTVQLRDVAIKFRGVNKFGKFGRFGNEEWIIDRTWLVPRLEDRSVDSGRVIHPTENNGRRLWPPLKPGRYAYDFELSLNQPLPETFNVGGCKLHYNMQAVAGISGLRRQVSQRREVSVVHCPQDELYLHEANQISLSRIWNRQIPYHVELSNRSAPIGGKVPIAVRIGCSDILFIAVQIFLAQKIKFPGNPAKQTQIRKKLLLKSKCNDLSTGKFHDKLPSLNLDREPGTTMITGSVPLLDEPKTTLRLHPDVNYKKVKATHSMLFVIDITIPNLDPSTSQKTTICRLTAETPFRIRSPRTHTYDMSVPQYTETHNSAIYDNILPPPFSSSPSPLPLSPRSSHSSTDTDDPELSRRKFSSVSFSSSCTPVCSATDHVCPPPAYESIF